MTVQYRVQYRIHGTTQWNNWPPDGSLTSNLSLTIGTNPPGPSLQAGTQYDCQVEAINAFGTTTSPIITGSTVAAVTISSVNLSNLSFNAGSAIGTVVGNISVIMSSGSFTGTLSISGNDAASFQIVNGQLQLATNATVAGTYAINIVATQNGAANSPDTVPFTLTSNAVLAESIEAFTVSTVGPIVYASQNMGVASVSGPWNQFALSNTGTPFQITLDTGSGPVIQAASGSVVALVYHSHTLFQHAVNASTGLNDWWYWNTTTAAYVEYRITAINLSSLTYAANLAAGSTVATISQTVSDAGAFSNTYTYTLSGTNASSFVLSGTTLKVGASALSAASYSISITATPNTVGNALTTNFTLNQTVVQTLTQINTGIHTGTGLADNRSGWSSPLAHYNGYNSVMGLTAQGRHAVLIGSANGSGTVEFGGGAPNTWPSTGGDSLTWKNNGFPLDGSVGPLLHWTFSDGTTNTNYAAYSQANISTSTSYPNSSGQTIAFYIQRVLNGWKTNVPNIKKIYCRMQWEWNIGGPGANFNLNTAANVPPFVEGWRGFANVCHDWGNANGVSVAVVWSPSVFGQIDINSYGVPPIQHFAAPDANAHAGSDGVTHRYIDVVGPDFYGPFDPRVGHDGLATDGTFNRNTNQRWAMNAMVDLARNFNIPIGISECNDSINAAQTGYQNWIPNLLVPWLNTLNKSNYVSVGGISGPAHFEYVCFFDINVGGATCFSAPAGGDLSLFGQAFGSLTPTTFGSCPQVFTA